MADQQELAVREKKEMATKEERTVPGRFFVPQTDVYETEDALTVVMEMPGVDRKDVEVELKEDVLRVEGRIDFSKYERHGAGLHRVQRRTLLTLLHALRQGRPGAHRGAA